MKRLLVLVAVLVPLSLFVAGCGGPGGSSGSSGKKTMEPTPEKMRQMEEMMKSGKTQPPGPYSGAPAK